jgi:hypothetical protein
VFSKVNIQLEYIKSSFNSTTKGPTTQLEKWANGLNRYLSKEEIQVAKKQIERCSTSFIIRKMQIKTTRYLCIPTRTFIIRKI